MPLQSRYPQGAEKVLIEKTTGREVPRGGLPADAGVIVLNVTTVSTLGKYLATGMPLTTKRLTVDGDAIGEAKNVEVVIGTPIGDVLDFCGVKDDVSKILMGGPMMGTAVADPAFPVLKQNNALVAFRPGGGRSARSRPVYPLRQLHQCLPHGPFACGDRGRVHQERRRDAGQADGGPVHRLRNMQLCVPGQAAGGADDEPGQGRVAEK